LIKYNGAQVSPHEIEDVVKSHSAVVDAAVVGLEMRDGNELPTAFVVLKEPTAKNKSQLLEEIDAWTTQRVSPYKRLRGGVHVVDTIPNNAMGKLLYKDLRAMAQALSHRNVQAKL
jgi:acyl-coenzyme A synthetase/AMP-(fatty) acid ligase